MIRFVWLLCIMVSNMAMGENHVRVGSKSFTEGYILSEIISQAIEEIDPNIAVNRIFGLGGTGIIYEALRTGKIDLYPEYTGTIAQEILTRGLDLESAGLVISCSLGFNNNYALAVRREFAENNKLANISDLKNLKSLKAGFSHEFMQRSDGYPGLIRQYGLNLNQVHSMEHSLTYEAIAKSKVDLIDVYSTDPKIQKFDLVLLKDDLKFFPDYQAVMLARADFVKKNPELWTALKSRLEGRFSEEQMIRLNAEADLEKKPFSKIAADFLQYNTPNNDRKIIAPRLWSDTRQHLFLVGISLAASILIGIPLGIIAIETLWLGQFILAISGLLQTIPSIALLCFFIPIFGVGTLPALMALFLYGLLPIITGTYSGLKNLDLKLLDSAKAIGLSRFQSLKWIEIPLASPSILAGVKVSAIISIGTATLAAFIGAGGYGAPIVIGLALNDIPMILSGAIPAAIMAIMAHFLFEWLGRWIIPRGLRQSTKQS